MNKENLVSIVIPVYNRAAFLPRLFASLRKITWSPVEIILVDNDSSDASFAMCMDFKQKNENERFRIIVERETRRGACCCRNKGLSVSSGNYVYFFDSDDEMSPHYVSDMLSIAGSGVDMVCAPTMMQFPNGKRQRRAFVSNTRVSQAIISSSLSTQSMFFHRDFILRIGGWNEALLRWNDWELGIRALCYHPKVVYSNKAYHTIHLHNDSITGVSFSQDYSHLRKAATIVVELLLHANLPHKELSASLNALAAKLYLLSQQLHIEKDKNAENDAIALAKRLTVAHSKFAFFVPLIRLYAKLGGRGAWRMYAALL